MFGLKFELQILLPAIRGAYRGKRREMLQASVKIEKS
jgi:hypothetical protein